LKAQLGICVILLALGNVVSLPVIADNPSIDAAIANENRTDVHRERDARSHPDIILGLMDLQPGQHVVDILGGGGYYAELIAGVVGPSGSVVLHNNTPYARFVAEPNQTRYVEEGVPGVSLLNSEVDDLKLGAERFDAAIMVMSYHDLYYDNPDRGWFDTDMALFYSQVRDALKPGGKLMIIDHSAAVGSGSSAAQDIHRIEEAYAIEDVESHGFDLVATSDVLRNAEDDRTKMVFDKSVRGKTDRFVLLFEKGAAKD
jgi:predicted methyltransferase